LVEIGQIRNLDLLDEWYEKALSFERSRRETIEEFRGRRSLENSGDTKKKPVLDILCYEHRVGLQLLSAMV